ncbi:hypothetical protein WA026_023359 [Henosepilachna vigintioctopunctata]|uniref:MADF domain-containing protein n=1 Tax=Henosepilachna vigintioctopunctata TaxID=420089 RepID=A0AAW1UWQ8_9CUCU
MDWTNENVLEFLEEYEKESVIWNPAHGGHKNRNLVYDAWKRIEFNLGEKYSVTELKKKKESLMATFRSLYNKVKESSKNGAEAEKVYQPNWFAYEKMASFLRKKNQTEDPTTEMVRQINILHSLADKSWGFAEDNSTYGETKEEMQENIYEFESIESDKNNAKDEVEPSTSNSFSKRCSQKRKRTVEEDEPERKLDDAYSVLQSITEKVVKEKDYLDKYGEVVAERLRQLEDRNRDIAINRIDNILFELKMNQGFCRNY